MTLRRSPYGWGRVSAAVLGAPAAALLVAVALPALVPAPSPLRYLIACIATVPLVAAAPVLALLAGSGARAWGWSALAGLLGGIVLWRAW